MAGTGFSALEHFVEDISGRLHVFDTLRLEQVSLLGLLHSVRCPNIDAEELLANASAVTDFEFSVCTPAQGDIQRNGQQGDIRRCGSSVYVALPRSL